MQQFSSSTRTETLLPSLLGNRGKALGFHSATNAPQFQRSPNADSNTGEPEDPESLQVRF